MGWHPEDLTPQIDGVADTFSTTFPRSPSQLIVFRNGEQVPPAQFTEPTSTTIKTGFVPQLGDTLLVHYYTDATFDGRVIGYAEDPTSPPVVLPEGLEELLDDIDNRIDVLEGSPPGANELPPLSGIDGNVLTEVQPGNALAFLPPPGGGGGGGAVDFRRKTFVPGAGQTVFALDSNIGDNQSVLFFVNTVQYVLGLDFLVTGANQLTWTDAEFTLDGSDLVEVVYVSEA